MWPKNFKLNRSFIITALIWLGALLLRILTINQPAHGHDINLFEAWGSHMLRFGPTQFYATTWSDYLPLPLYLLAPIVSLTTWLHLPFGLVFKTILSLFESILIYLIVKNFPYKGKILILALLALSPALIGDTAYWGQIDALPSLLALLATVLLLSRARILFAGISLGLSIALKPIILIIAPCLWLLSRPKNAWWKLPTIAFLTFITSAFSFVSSPLSALPLLFNRALTQATTYPYTTINAWNIWSVVPPLTWPPDNQLVLGLSAHTAGLLMFTFLSLLVLRNWYRVNWSPKYSFRVIGTILVAFFVFTTRMHERHLLFGLPFLAIAAALQSWLILPTFILSLTFTLNLYAAYYWFNHTQTWPFSPSFVSLVSWVNTLMGLALATIWHWPKFLKSLTLNLRSNKVITSILVIATLLRFVNLSHPPVYIFDEVYHAFTAREYLAGHIEAWEWWTTPPEGVAYEWTHPGVAKYGMVLGMLFFGENSFGWRVGSATFGIISILGLYFLVLRLTKNKPIALLSAFLVSIEGTHIAQSRVAMNDIYMLAFYVWALYAGITSRWKMAAVLYGLALGSKWSALYGVIPLAFIYLHEHNPNNWNLKSGISHLFFAIRHTLIALLVYVLTFTPFILAGHTWEQFIELHRQMWYYHTHLVATHTYQSTPREWIFAARPVWYWVDYAQDVVSHIFVQGNPLILWLGLVAIALQLGAIRYFRYSLFLVLYSMFILPWIFSPRIMFYYHYLPSASFLCVILATRLSSLSPRLRNGLMVVCFIGLILVFPMLFGFPMSTTYWDSFFRLFSSWK